MKHLSLVARIATPSAMVVFLSYELSGALSVTGWWYIALLIGSICTAVGVEIVGILAGHTLEGYAHIGNQPRAIVSFGLLMIYTATAVYILAGSALVVVPIIAAIVYVLAALSDGLDTAVNQQATETAVQKTFDLQQAAADRDLERQLKLELARAKTAARYQTPQRQLVRQDTGKLPHDWRQLTTKQRHDLAHLPREARNVMMPELSERARRDWHVRLDEIAAQNGSYKVQP